MAQTSVINVAILGDARKFKRAVGEAGDKLGAFSAKIGKVSANVVKGFGIMGAAAGGLAVVAGRQLFNLGEELTSLDQKINTVFTGQSLEQVTGWADEVAARIGLTSTQAAGLAANAGDLLKPMGFTADEAAKLSTDVIGLAGALSEWSGGQRSVTETADILQKALLGERDSLKSLGISINQAEVDQRALTIAQAAGREEINAQDKAIATQQLLLEKSTDAQAAFAAGGNKLTAAQNKLRAAFGELQERLARKLLPVFAQVADIVVRLIDVFDEQGLGGVISDVSQRVQAAWPQIRQQLEVWARGFVDWLQRVGPPLFAALADLLARLGGWFIDDGLPIIVNNLKKWAAAFVDWIQPLIGPFFEKLGELISRFANWFVEDGLDLIVDSLARWAAAFLEWIGPLIGPMLRQLLDLLIDVGKWLIMTGAPAINASLQRWADEFTQWIVDVGPDVLEELQALLIEMSFIIGLEAKALGGRLVSAIVEGIEENGKAILIALRNIFPGGSLLSRAFDAISSSGFYRVPEFRASGGPVSRNMPYLVGERGPELFVPNSAGNIVPNNAVGGAVNVTVNMAPGADGADVVRSLQRYARSHGGFVPILTGQL